jgi:hypothetical protein
LHLHVVLSEADGDGFHLVASITTIYPDMKYDNTCELQAGEHEFITHPSYVLYRHADTARGSHIEAMVNGGVYKEKSDCTDALLKKILAGIEKSAFTRGYVLAYYRKMPK